MYKEEPQIRNTNIEVLRFMLMAFICFWHVITHGYGFKYIGKPFFTPIDNMGGATFFLTLFCPAVYCFMFISGWYGINFSLRRFFRYVFFAYSCHLLGLIIRYICGEPVTHLSIFLYLFPIASSRWWFLTCYVMIFCLAPLIDYGMNIINRRTIKHIIIIMTILEVLSITNPAIKMGSTFFGLLYIYILGRYLKKYRVEFKNKHLLTCYVISFVCLWGLCYFTTMLPGIYSRISFLLLSYNNPLIILMAFSLFMIVKNQRPHYSKITNILLSNVIVIYLLTSTVDDFLYKYEVYLININLIMGIAFVFITMIVSLFIGLFLSFTFEFLFKSAKKYY